MNVRIKGSGGSRILVLLAGPAALLWCAIAASPAWAMDCQVATLSALGVPNITITSATDVAAAAPNPQYCDVKGSVTPSGEGAGPNSARFEAKMPAPWNEKCISNGVGRPS